MIQVLDELRYQTWRLCWGLATITAVCSGVGVIAILTQWSAGAPIKWSPWRLSCKGLPWRVRYWTCRAERHRKKRVQRELVSELRLEVREKPACGDGALSLAKKQA